MSKEDGYKIRNKEGKHFISFAVVDWIDVFTRKIYKDIFVDSIKYCQEEKGLQLHSWCLMTNHAHLVFGAKENNPSDLLRDFKKFTSKKLIKAIQTHSGESRKKWMLALFKEAGEGNSRNKNYQFWQQANHPKELFSRRFIDQKINYVHNNPVEAEIVEKLEDYLYSSARDYIGKEKGLLEIIRL